MSFTKKQNSKYYYAYNEKVYLAESENKLIVRYNQNKQSDKKRISMYLELVNKKFEWIDDSTCIITFNASEKELFKDKIKQQADIKTCSAVFTIGTDMEMGVTDEFLVKFNENVSKSEIANLHRKFRVEVVTATEFYQLLKVPSGSDVLEIANSYQESGLTRFSHPNFIDELKSQQIIPNDPFFQNQFSLHNTGQVFTDGHSGTVDADIDAPEAWTITKGNSNIVIAVVDDGLTFNHPDMPNSRQVRLNGSNFSIGDPNDPSPTDNYNHGNACAGIIAATQNNNEGITGIAPNCKIMPIRVTGVWQVNRIADAMNFAWQHGADILSLSRTYNKTDPNTYPVIRDAIIDATTKGRNGLGCIVVNSSGNTANHLTGNNGAVLFPANVDVAGVLTVGASDRYDLQAQYSPTGNPYSSENQIIDIVAPSHRAYSCQIQTETYEAWSIDIPNNSGYNPVNSPDCLGGPLPVIGSRLPNSGINYLAYTGRFGGTSYSCPQVAGVAALILSINPNLTQRQVFDIITATADKVGGYSYINERSNEMGFGRLNAYRALLKTVSMIASVSGPVNVCSSSATFYVSYLPSTYPVFWEKSSNLTYVSGQNTNNYIVKSNGTGEGWVKATVNFGSGNATLPQKTVWVGIPSQPLDIIGFSYNGKHFGSNSYYDFHVSASLNQGISLYEWVVGGGIIDYGQGTNQITVLTCDAGDIDIYFDVSVRVDNGCGWSPWLWRTGYVDDGVGPAYMVSPNPANSTITISAIDNTRSVQNTSQLEPIKRIRIFDKMGLPFMTQEYSGKDNRVTLNISSLPKGVFLIKINDKESHTIIKE